MNAKKLGLGIVGIFLIGIVAASFLPYFGVITGTATVTAPVFYLGGNATEGGVYHNLLVDQIPSSEEEVYFYDGHREVFKTGNLNVSYFYPITLHAYVWMKTNFSGSKIQARFLKLNNNNNEQTICEVSNPVVVTATNYFSEYDLSCNSSGQIDLSTHNKIGLELRGNGNESIDYRISTGHSYTAGYSRIEVIPQ